MNKYIVIGIRSNPDKTDYPIIYKHVGGQPVIYDCQEAAQRQADSMNNADMSVYNAKPIWIGRD